MENLTSCLESSTIHGLAYIATGRKYVRLFWTLVVIAGFTGAGVLIYSSFQSWADSPVKTTIETHPIAEITFPKVTVCPPKDTFTDLNYDLMMTKNMTLDYGTRQELSNYAVELLYDYLYDNIIRNMRKLVENDRYYNWYYGYTGIDLPYFYIWCECLLNEVATAATSGSIITQYFGEEFDEDKVETYIRYHIKVYPPASVRSNPNLTLHLDIEKVSMKDLAGGDDDLVVHGLVVDGNAAEIFSNQSYIYTPHSSVWGTPLREYYEVKLDRQVLPADVKKQKLDLMPGFRLTWRYSGMEVEPDTKYYNNNTDNPRTIAFVRNYSNNVLLILLLQ